MSSSNPSRGKRDSQEAKANEWKNRLLLTISAYAKRLKPKVIVAENVRQLLTLEVSHGRGQESLLDILRRELAGYEVFSGVVNVSDYGIPQDRRRAVMAQRKRRSAQISRQLRPLRGHGLLKKVPKTHRYHLTDRGRVVLTALAAARHASTEKLVAQTA